MTTDTIISVVIMTVIGVAVYTVAHVWLHWI